MLRRCRFSTKSRKSPKILISTIARLVEKDRCGWIGQKSCFNPGWQRVIKQEIPGGYATKRKKKKQREANLVWQLRMIINSSSTLPDGNTESVAVFVGNQRVILIELLMHILWMICVRSCCCRSNDHVSGFFWRNSSKWSYSWCCICKTSVHLVTRKIDALVGVVSCWYFVLDRRPRWRVIASTIREASMAIVIEHLEGYRNIDRPVKNVGGFAMRWIVSRIALLSQQTLSSL